MDNNKSHDWGGDYSYLLHSIEGKIKYDSTMSSNISPTPNNIGTTRKRLRLSYLSDSNDISTINNHIINTPINIKQQAEIDELQLINEQLEEKLQIQIDLNNNLKEKYIKQITFLENDNNKLKDSLNNKNDQYYDEKKKWLNKQRELEKQINLLVNSNNNKSVNANDIIKKSNDITPEYQYYKDKYNELSKFNKEKMNEYNELIKTLQDKITNLEIEVNNKRSIQDENIKLIKNQSEREIIIIDLRKSIYDLNQTNELLNNKVNELNTTINTLANQLIISKQYNSLHSNEINSLRQILKTYDTEYNIYNKQRSGTTATSNSITNKSNKLYEETIKILQEDLDKCRNEAKVVIEQALSLISTNNTTSYSDSADDKLKIVSLENKLLDIQEKYEELQVHTRTDFIPGHTKVLHMISNPYSESTNKSTIDQISTVPIYELQRLRKQVKSMNSKELENNNVTTLAGNFNINTTNESPDNESKLAIGPDSNKLNLRLKEMFKDRITSFREAVYLLTGYKIDLYSAEEGTNNLRRLRLRSMYAESPEDSLMFQWRGDTLELLETPYTTKLDSKHFQYLNSFHSVPAFLANITIDLLENQTFMG